MKKYRHLLLPLIAVCIVCVASRILCGDETTDGKLPIDFFGIRPLQTLVQDPDVRVAIDLNEDQYLRARQLWEGYKTNRVEAVRAARSFSNDEAKVYLDGELAKNRARVPKLLHEILDAGQRTRLQQIAFQVSIRYFGVSLLQSAPVVNAIGLNEKEFAKWKVVLQHEDKRLREATTARKRTGEAKHTTLTPEQRTRFDDVYGERFNNGSLPTPGEDKGLAGLTPWSPLFDFLRYAHVRKELELIDDQHEQVQALLTNFTKEYSAARRKTVKDRRNEAAQEELAKTVRSLQEGELPQLERVLLPHQLKRLRQLVFQARVHERFVDPLRSPLVAVALQLTETQQRHLQGKLNDEAAQSKAENAELWDEVLKNCIDTLTLEQQARYQRLVGKQFDPK